MTPAPGRPGQEHEPDPPEHASVEQPDHREQRPAGTTAERYNNQGWYDNIITVDPSIPNRVWAGGIDLFRSDDGGANWGLASYWWAARSNPRFAHADQHAIVFHPAVQRTSNQTLYVGNDGGLFRTDNAAPGQPRQASVRCNSGTRMVWTILNNNYGATQFYRRGGLPRREYLLRWDPGQRDGSRHERRRPERLDEDLGR